MYVAVFSYSFSRDVHAVPRGSLTTCREMTEFLAYSICSGVRVIIVTFQYQSLRSDSGARRISLSSVENFRFLTCSRRDLGSLGFIDHANRNIPTMTTRRRRTKMSSFQVMWWIGTGVSVFSGTPQLPHRIFRSSQTVKVPDLHQGQPIPLVMFSVSPSWDTTDTTNRNTRNN